MRPIHFIPCSPGRLGPPTRAPGERLEPGRIRANISSPPRVGQQRSQALEAEPLFRQRGLRGCRQQLRITLLYPLPSDFSSSFALKPALETESNTLSPDQCKFRKQIYSGECCRDLVGRQPPSYSHFNVMSNRGAARLEVKMAPVAKGSVLGDHVTFQRVHQFAQAPSLHLLEVTRR